ncbi:unnamed protein product [Vicia faba]|uniref:Uncharacterized protein n=1 Tax=Vicia faba TaxID=3906 RepID=A0AAV1BBB6_VICFA|nr:unnamed protein product [Vicia faba]
MKKLSFSFTSSKSSFESNNFVKLSQTFDEDFSTKQDLKKQLITEFDSSKLQTLDPNPKTLIPPIKNQWCAHQKMKNLDLLIIDSHYFHSFTFESNISSISDQPDSDK